MPKRIKIESLTTEHGPKYLEELTPGEVLESAMVYVDPKNGQVFDGSRGHKVSDLRDEVIEIPRTTWY